MMSGRALGHTGGTLDKLESIPGFRTDLSQDEFKAQLGELGLCFIGQTDRLAPADRKLYALRDVTGTVESIPLISSSIMSKKLAEGVDALVLDVKVGNGAFMKKQVDARRLAQTMVGIGRRMDKKVQALITDMNQPLGYAIGNALEVMEVSQTLQNAGPDDLTKLSLELAAHMIYLGKKADTLEEARRTAERHLVDGSAYRKFKQVVAAQGGNAQALDKFELLPNATGMREITSPRAGYVSLDRRRAISDIASNMIGAGRDKKDDPIDPAVGIILEVKIRREGGCRLGAVPSLLHQGRSRGRSRRHGGRRLPHLLAEARRARTDSGSGRSLMGRFTGLLGLVVILAAAWLFSSHKRAIKLRIIAWGLGLQFAFAFLVLKTDFGKMFQAIGAGVNAMLAYTEAGSAFVFGEPLGTQQRSLRRDLRLPGAAHHHLHRVVLLDSVLPRHHAVGRARHGHRDAEGDGRERRRIAQRGRQHLHGPDGSAPDHPPVPRRPDRVGAVHHHDQRHGARFRLGDGGLRQDRRRARSSTC